MHKKKILLILALILVIGLGTWFFIVGKHAIHLYQARQEVKTLLAGGLDSASPAYAFQLLNEIDRDLKVIDQNLGWTYPILNSTGKMTSQVQPAVKYLKAMVKFVLLFEEKLDPFIRPVQDNQMVFTSLLNEIAGDQALLTQAKFYADEITFQHDRLDITALPFRFQDDFLMLEAFIPLVKAGGHILPMIPEMSGINQPASYLLLAQNHDELRGGGGFITAIGTITLNSLTNIEMEMQDSYQVDNLSMDYPLPPQPLQDYMLAGMWLPRDGNWSADFPTSAHTVQQLYQLSTGDKTLGVIAFDQLAVKELLTVMGPINIDADQNMWVDASNVIDYMHDSWGQEAGSQNWWANRKDFVAVLGKAMLEDLINTRDYKKMVGLGKTVHNLIKSGHLMMYFSDPIQQKVLADLNLDGAVRYLGGDYLYWVDSNIGFNKVDAVIDRKLSYEVDLSELENPQARIIMSYEHSVEEEVPCVHEATYGKEIAYENMYKRCYWDYWRVYVAPGSELVNANVQFIPGEFLLSGKDWSGELDLESDLPGLNMVGGLQILPTNKNRQLELELELSPNVLTSQTSSYKYQLQFIKQLGLYELPLEIKLIIPDGYKFSTLPEGAVVSQNTAWIKLGNSVNQQQIIIIFSKLN